MQQAARELRSACMNGPLRRFSLLAAGHACLATGASNAGAQARPDVPGRIWGEVSVSAVSQSPACRDCNALQSYVGRALTGSAGLTLSRGLGVAVVGRAFHTFNFDFSRGSRYVIAIGQFTPSQARWLTVNAGAGRVSHDESDSPARYEGSGAAILFGAALRLPPLSRFALSLTSDMTHPVGGSGYRATAFSIGLGINISSGESSSSRSQNR